MLQRLVLLLVVISLCGYGTAWAYSDHSSDITAHISIEIDDHDAPGDEGCDHCCHAGSHLTALVCAVPGLSHRPAEGCCTSGNSAIPRLSQAPPFKPPRH